MKIIRPIVVTDSVLTSSNIVEDDYPIYNNATSYTVGTKVIVLATHKIYEALRSTTGEYPPDNTLGETPAWLDLGATNRWKMFDSKTSTFTTNPTGNIDVTLQPTAIFNSLAFFGLFGAKLTITVTDINDGVVYDKEFDLSDNTAVTSWYTYYFEPITGRSDITILDLPPYSQSDVRILIEGNNTSCGLCIIGAQKDIGVTDYGTSIGITDYSRKDTDDFGNPVITQRRFSKRADFNVTIDIPRVSDVQKTLAEYRTTPLVWIGNNQFEETILYGYYRDFDITLSNYSIADCSITVEGL